MSSHDPKRPGTRTRPPADREPGEGPGVRLQRVMADAGVASRRDCEEMIQQGVVEVNGKIVDHLPAFVNPGKDRIVVDGQPIKVVKAVGSSGNEGRLAGRVYVMLHKPDRVLCTTRDEVGDGTAGSSRLTGAAAAGRTTVTELVEHPSEARLYPAGRLDYHTTGLVLMTNDGVLVDRLTHARYGITRTYRVTIKGKVTQELLRDLRRRLGVERTRMESNADVAGRIAGGRRVGAGGGAGGGEPDSVRLVREPGQMTTIGHNGVREEVVATNSVIEITLREGKSRQLRAILEQMGALTRKLTRTAIGPLRLRGVAVGQWRDLTREEVELLMQTTGLKPKSGGGTGSSRAGAGGGKGGKRPRTAGKSSGRGFGEGNRSFDNGGRGRSESRGSKRPRGERRP